jgi:hypothetical protein
MMANLQEMTDALRAGADVETLFLAEMRARRERLAQWIALIHDEVRLQDGVARPSARASHRCRGTAGRRAHR